MRRPPNLRMTWIGVGTLVISAGGQTLAGDHCPFQRVTAAHQSFDARFGFGLDIDGDTAIVGAYQHGHPPYPGGSAHVFRRIGEAWIETQELHSSAGGPTAKFGFAVAMDGERALISAPGHVYGPPGTAAGSVYVFQSSEDGWTEVHELRAWSGSWQDNFGVEVELNGDVAVVAAPLDDDVGVNAGAVYVFRFNGSDWFQEQKLSASDPQSGAGFGISVSIDGDTILIGASGYDVPSTILETQCQPVVDPRITTGRDDGAAYIFRYNRTARRWIQQQQIIASDAGGLPGGDCGLAFGVSVSISGDTAIVGARGAASPNGAAYVFREIDGAWVEVQRLVPPDSWARQFGRSVAIDGDRAVIGAPFSWSFGTPGSSAGAAYLFHYNGREWAQSQPVLVPQQWGIFGGAVAISGQRALVGAEGEFDFRGAAYFYMMTEDADLNCDGAVNGLDLGNLLANWSIPPDTPGCQGDTPCAADLNDDGLVNGIDLGMLLANWTL